MKKIITLIVSVAILLLSCVTASAESVANFNVTLVSETDKEAVITIDFVGGTGFSGLDFDMTVNSSKVKVTGAEKGAGFANFESQGGTAFAIININSDPIKATALTLNSFRIVDGKDIFRITLKKLTKENLTAGDIVVDITNCVDSAQQPIRVSLTTDLQGSSSAAATTTTTTTAATEKTTETASSASQTDTDTSVLTNSVEGTSGEVIDIENPSDDEYVPEDALDDTDGEDDGKSNTPIIIAVAAVVLAAGIVAVVLVVMKKKKSTDGE